MTLPNFLIIGAAKAGTTSLYNYLEQHPDVFMSPDKEPRFFAFEGDTSGKYPYTEISKYESLYNGAKAESAIGEASTFYLCSKDAPYCIKKYIPDVKLIAILRNPIDRAYSHYVYWKREGKEIEEDFSRVVDRELDNFDIDNNDSYISRGMYGYQLERFYKIFSKENIRIYDFEDLKNNPKDMCDDVFDFLGLSQYSIDFSKSYNATTVPTKGLKQIMYSFFVRQNYIQTLLVKFLPDWLYWKVVAPMARGITSALRSKNREAVPALDPVVRDKLKEVYRSDILNIERLTGKDFHDWLN